MVQRLSSIDRYLRACAVITADRLPLLKWHLQPSGFPLVSTMSVGSSGGGLPGVLNQRFKALFFLSKSGLHAYRERATSRDVSHVLSVVRLRALL